MKIHHTMLYILSFLVIIGGVFGIEKQKLVFSTSQYLKEIDLDTGVVQTLTTHADTVYSLAYDNKEKYLYVPRYNTRDIVRFLYPTNHTVMLETIVSASNPLGIAFDSKSSYLYWTELASNKIKRCNPDGSNVTSLVNEYRPSAITLDIQNRWIYYGQDTSPSKIFRTNFDGMDKRVIINNVAASVYGIVVDVDNASIYWMDYQTGDLQSASFNGSDVKRIISTNATSQNLNIDIDGDFIFYTNKYKILKINKSSGQNPTVVHTDTEKIFAVLFYKQEECSKRVCFQSVDMHVCMTTSEDSLGSWGYKEFNCDKEFLEYLRSECFPRTFLLGL